MTLDVRELLRRLRAGEADRAIARDLGLARKTAARYREMAQDEGWLVGPLPAPGELSRCLQKRVPRSNLPRQPFKAAKHRERIEALRKEGVNLTALYRRLQEEDEYRGSYAALRRYVVHLEGRVPEAFVRVEVAAGEEAQVDFGSAGEIVDRTTGELRRAWVFVMTLSHSRHQYATIVFDQRVGTWLRCHREAFEWFGGVPRRVVLDNLKAAIVRAAFRDPVVQRSYREFAEHYGFLISPCRPKTPRHKGKVESGVRYVKGNFLCGRTFRNLAEANGKLLEWVERVAGERIHGTTKKRPIERFRAVEQERLLPLPAVPYDWGVWKKAKLHPDCHVVVDGAYYSAPHRLIGRKLWVRTNGRDVHVFCNYERVATHPWGPPGTRRTNPVHYPPDKVAYLMATPAYCRRQAKTIGGATSEVVGRLLRERPLDRLRTVQAVLRLAKTYDADRLEAACRRALRFDDLAYETIQRILEKGLDRETLPGIDRVPPRKRTYVFARSGSEIFLTEGDEDHGTEGTADPEAQGVAALGSSGDAGSA